MAEKNAQEVQEVASGLIEVSAKKEGFNEIKINYDFGATLQDMVEKFGEEIVFTNARANMKITLQGVMRRYLGAGKDQEEIAAACAEWKPGVQMERVVDPLAVAKKAMDGMDDEAKQAFIAQLLAN